MAIVTVSASYGAGGSEVAPALARRLNARFVDRAIATTAADSLPTAENDGVFWRVLRGISPVGSFTAAGIQAQRAVDDRLAYRDAIEDSLREAAGDGDVVILGRAGALALRDDPRALHVRLHGPEEARVRQAMRIEGVDEDTARRRLRDNDRARERYVRDFYGVDPADPGLYAIVLDGTRLDAHTCVATIAAAVLARDEILPA